jgi:hypothetical protein
MLLLLLSFIFIPQLAEHLFDIRIPLDLYIMIHELFPLLLLILPTILHLPLLLDLELFISIIVLLLILRAKMQLLQLRTLSQSLPIPVIKNIVYFVSIQLC